MDALLRLPALAAALAALAGPASPWAFQNLQVGDPLADREMPTVAGGREHLLGRARANVFVFFRPGQDHSLDLLRRLAGMEREFAGKPVRFVAIVSGDQPVADVEATVQQAGIRMPVLVDRGDALYGELGVRLHPVVGIADENHRLAAYEHFREINMEERIRARIRRLLGEIGDAEVQRALEPPAAAVESGSAVVARRYLNLARALLKARSYEKAREMARRSLEADPGLAAARAVIGRAFAEEGRCREAREALEAALRLDPRDPDALEGGAACAGR